MSMFTRFLIAAAFGGLLLASTSHAQIILPTGSVAQVRDGDTILVDGMGNLVADMVVDPMGNVTDLMGVFSGGGTGFVSGDPTHCLLYTSPSPRDLSTSRMPSSA